jgi:hypothetical protein
LKREAVVAAVSPHSLGCVFVFACALRVCVCVGCTWEGGAGAGVRARSSPTEGALLWSLPPVQPLEPERLHRWGHSACLLWTPGCPHPSPATAPAPSDLLVVFGGFMGHLCHNRTSELAALRLGTCVPAVFD